MPCVGSSSSRTLGRAAVRDGDLEATLLAVRQRAGQFVGTRAELERVEQFGDAGRREAARRDRPQRAAAAFEELRGEPQVLVHRQVEEQVGDLERPREPGREQAVRRWPVTSWPSSTTRPRLGRMAPLMRLKSALLPAPFGPITAVMAPRSRVEARRRRRR